MLAVDVGGDGCRVLVLIVNEEEYKRSEKSRENEREEQDAPARAEAVCAEEDGSPDGSGLFLVRRCGALMLIRCFVVFGHGMRLLRLEWCAPRRIRARSPDFIVPVNGPLCDAVRWTYS